MDLLNAMQEALTNHQIHLSWQQTKVYSNMVTCHTLERGGRILECPECGSRMVSYNPCNQRGCPSCGKKNQLTWQSHTQKKLLQTSHNHIVFSPPEEWITKWFEEPEDSINELLEIVSKAMKEYIVHIGLSMGYVLVFQSHGKGLCYKPHVHCILTAGGIDETRKWKTHNTVMANYLETFLEGNWKVHTELHKDTPNRIIGYLGKAGHGLPIDIEHDVQEDREKKTVTIVDNHCGEDRITTLPVLVFLERYLNHIPPSHVVTIRYYGLYSNRQAEDLKEIRSKIPSTEKPESIEGILAVCKKCGKPMTICFEFEERVLNTNFKNDSFLGQGLSIAQNSINS